MKSLWNINLSYRLITFFVWIMFLASLNFAIFAPFMKYNVSFTEVILIITLWILTYLLVKNMKYIYEISDWKLFIKTPRSKFNIPLSDIEKVGTIDNIPFYYRIWMKFDFLNRILYLCGYTNKWIILLLKDKWQQIVISPRKFDEFYKLLLKNETNNK